MNDKSKYNFNLKRANDGGNLVFEYVFASI